MLIKVLFRRSLVSFSSQQPFNGYSTLRPVVNPFKSQRVASFSFLSKTKKLSNNDRKENNIKAFSKGENTTISLSQGGKNPVYTGSFNYLYRCLGVGVTLQFYSSVLFGGYYIMVSSTLPFFEKTALTGTIVAIAGLLLKGVKDINDHLITNISSSSLEVPLKGKTKTPSTFESYTITTSGLLRSREIHATSSDIRYLNGKVDQGIVKFGIFGKVYWCDFTRGTIQNQLQVQNLVQNKQENSL